MIKYFKDKNDTKGTSFCAYDESEIDNQDLLNVGLGCRSQDLISISKSEYDLRRSKHLGLQKNLAKIRADKKKESLAKLEKLGLTKEDLKRLL